MESERISTPVSRRGPYADAEPAPRGKGFHRSWPRPRATRDRNALYGRYCDGPAAYWRPNGRPQGGRGSDTPPQSAEPEHRRRAERAHQPPGRAPTRRTQRLPAAPNATRRHPAAPHRTGLARPPDGPGIDGSRPNERSSGLAACLETFGVRRPHCACRSHTRQAINGPPGRMAEGRPDAPIMAHDPLPEPAWNSYLRESSTESALAARLHLDLGPEVVIKQYPPCRVGDIVLSGRPSSLSSICPRPGVANTRARTFQSRRQCHLPRSERCPHPTVPGRPGSGLPGGPGKTGITCRIFPRSGDRRPPIFILVVRLTTGIAARSAPRRRRTPEVNRFPAQPGSQS